MTERRPARDEVKKEKRKAVLDLERQIMKSARLADMLFTGLAIVPVLVILGCGFDVALLVFCPLLIAACLAGAHEQAMDAADERKSAHANGSRGDGPAPSLAMFERRITPDA